MSFIQDLYKKRSNYSDPDQATMQENSLEKLSSGIYTEGERFVFELLQNAVDAHRATDCLNVSICIQEGYLIFMHNGDAFTNEDIEGICFVGRKGEKVRNAKKIGYKGIGFKSVFGISSKVFVHTGNQCFRFDKDYWRSYWNENWSSSFGPKPTDLSEYTMPWQVIPIDSEVPFSFDEKNANVATYIAIDPEDEQKLADSIKGLMQSCRFLIFLKDNNIKMSFEHHGNTLCTIEKRTLNNEVVLYLNGTEDSRWMVYQNPEVPLNLTEEQKRRIEKHKSTPDKLKNAVSFDLSFAIAVEDGKLKKAEDAVLYTYLPTSYSFGDGFPFLVNANFITDEGRQHLDVDAEWNKVLISKIPEEYLKWIASFSKNHSNYYEVLPQKSYGSINDLLKTYEEAMKNALAKIAFIPSRVNNCLLKVNEAINDSIDFASVAGNSAFIAHINKEYSKQFILNSFFDCDDCQKFEEYGVFCFNESKLKSYFDDNDSIEVINPKKCKDIIDYLVRLSENSESKDRIMSILRDCKFLLCEDNTVKEPSLCYFPTEYSSENNSYVPLIHSTVFLHIKSKKLFDWFKNLGVENMSLSNYLCDVYCKQNYNIKIDNAIDVGKIVYDAFMKETLDDIPERFLKQLKFLSTKNNLFYADELYISHTYHPNFELEGLMDNDMFVSEKYAEYGDINIWKSIFLRLGMSESVNLKTRRYKGKFTDIVSVPENYKSEIIAIETSLKDPNCYINMYGYNIEYYPAILNCTDNVILAKLFNEIFNKEYQTEDSSCYLDYRWSVEEHLRFRGDFWKHRKDGFSFREFLLKYCQLYPTTTGEARYSNETFLNTNINISLCGEYLPVLSITNQINEDWISRIPFKRDLLLEDFLSLLSKIADDSETDNSERISNIYKRIVELEYQDSPIIKEWGKYHKILSADKGQYLMPKDLSYITVEGFKDTNKAYIGKHDKSNREGLLQLLKTFGVRIITEDNVKPTFDEAIPNTEISTRLLCTLPALTVLACDCNERKSYQECKEILQKKIENTKFYQCKKIHLAYDDSGDTISKITFAQEGKFYFTGELRPAKIEPLLHPLCSYLGIRGKERELFVIMTEPEFSGIIEYLEDKEYDVDDIKSEMHPIITSGGSVISVGGQIGGGIDKAKQIADSNEAKALVLAKLEKEGFDVSDVDSDWSVIKGVTRDGIAYPLVVKSCKNWDHKLFLNPDEWRQLFKPNSMLWLHLGNSVVAPIKAYELFTYQDKLSLTFDTVNLMMDDRINKIMEVMRYFNNVHLDVATLNPDQHRAEHLEEYLFDANNADNSDLSISPID